MHAFGDAAPHILVVDDDRRIRELIATFLTNHGLRVTVADGAPEAREKMRGLAFDLIVLDIMMKGETGIDLTRSIRAENNGVPILLLSALADPPDRVNGLASGSDDYLPKPFEPMELLLRIRSILRRSDRTVSPNEEVRFGACTFHIARGELRRNGEAVRLTTRERELLRLFVERAGRTIGRAELMHPGAEENARTIDVQINRLRRKIEQDPAAPVYLQTIRGAGYTLYLD
jgi:two-component system phosphate regulon response regulator OmpR